ncbi:MAG TPA: response regulator transcription factor [Parafilimonas sp.]|nr:response regulator transcription factor [Parafilimonas sp.]
MIKVIIYEDDFAFRETLSILIAGTDGYELKGAFENCNNITGHLKKFQPDVVIMDINMPGTDGIEGLRLVRGYDPDINVIMLTIFDDEERIFQAICNGANGYLLKKTPPSRILESISEVYSGGAPMTPSIARKVLQLFPKTPARSNEIDRLSSREQEILQLLMKGYSYKMIAAELNITIETVRTHIKRIYEKLHVHSAQEAINKIFPGRTL